METRVQKIFFYMSSSSYYEIILTQSHPNLRCACFSVYISISHLKSVETIERCLLWTLACSRASSAVRDLNSKALFS